MKRWVPPPGWPQAPHPGWSPPAGWQPDPSWPPAPAGWQYWQDVPRTGVLGWVARHKLLTTVAAVRRLIAIGATGNAASNKAPQTTPTSAEATQSTSTSASVPQSTTPTTPAPTSPV